jgi:DNA-binding transcriptional ArsR family regulator
VATHREGLDHLLLPARCAHERGQAAAAVRAQVLAAVEGTPGIGPVAMATAGALPISSVKRHLRELTAEGLIVADHRGTYRAAGAAPVEARNATDRLDELVRAKGRIRRSEAMAALGFSAKAMQSAVGNLRLRGRLLGPGKGKAAGWLEAAR